MNRRQRIFDELPQPVAERARMVTDRPIREDGAHVIYWMHHGVRGHENPALDLALRAASLLRRPLLVYQGLGPGHRFDNDRHHTFILEGARDVREQLEARGIRHAFWLGDDPSHPSPLLDLASRAALVVTEDFPAPPLPRWTDRLAARIDAPTVAVDTACVVPMALVGRAHDRAFAFRGAIRDLLAERLEQTWHELEDEAPAFDPADLGFEDVDLAREDIAELVARCPIDHTIGPIAHTQGGSAAGYERWRAFLANGLRGYAARRNDAAADGVSRMSPYLHHGHVSPLRLAREAASVGGKGADKYLDELIVWRELAHNLCFHRHAEVESLAVLPTWARETLQNHRSDRREVLAWEDLARGRTGDRLWDLCQMSLLRHGELHNNVRMTWGKAVPGWTETPERALELLIDLNHRFALDGSDPNSYGGLLWCLGLFDRPFEPERPVLGSVRSRATETHARRLDLDRYESNVQSPPTTRPMDVAVIGAGLSGLACARAVADHGHRVRVFDKARGPGGRMSTRRAGDDRFDHGAQYFTVRDPRFERWVSSWRRKGLVRSWDGTIAVLEGGTATRKNGGTDRWVAVPGMNAICAHLAEDLDVVTGTEVASPERTNGRWHLMTTDGEVLGRFDAVVVSAPAPQTARLLESAAPHLASRAGAVEMAPCWAVMATFGRPLELGFDGAFVSDSPLSWVARNGSKPGRPDAESWVLHGSPEWSRDHLEIDREEAAQRLLAAFTDAAGDLSVEPGHLTAHRWRFALPVEPLAEYCLFDLELGIAACGDWCGGPRVEGAFLSGCAAAGRILAMDPPEPQPSLFGEDR
jgi:photolyase PhrII